MTTTSPGPDAAPHRQRGPAGPSTLTPAEAVRRLVSELRVVGLHPVVASNFIAEGVLHDTGLAMWEMPANPTTGRLEAGGYNHVLFRPGSPASYAFYIDRARYPTDITEVDVGFLREGLMKPEMNFRVQDWPEYARPASSVCTQQMVLSPIHIGGTNFTFYRYPELGTLLALAQQEGMRVYANIGMANNPEFWSGELAFNILHAMKANAPYATPRLRVGVGMPQIQPDDWVAEGLAPTATARSPFIVIPWPHVAYDPTDADVLRLCREQIRFMARTYPTVWFVVNGEFGISSGCELTAANCRDCAPRTNFSAAAVRGFRNYMQRVEPLASQINVRWGLQGGARITTHAQIDPRTTHHCPYYLALRDFNAYQAMLTEEVTRQSYRAGKAEHPRSMLAYLTFGTEGTERGWLESDFAASGLYYILEKAQLPADPNLTASMHIAVNAARLSGRPVSMTISTPAGRPLGPPGVTRHFPPPLPPVFRAPYGYWYLECARKLSPDFTALFLREILTCHSFHISYLKAVFFSLKWLPSNVAVIQQLLAALEAVRTPSLRFSGPYQRAAVHLDPEGTREPSERVGRAILQHLDRERVPHAVFFRSRVLTRPFARELLRRSAVVVAFHQSLHADATIAGARRPLIRHYLDLYRRTAGGVPGVLVVLAGPSDAFLALLPRAEFTTTFATNHVRLQWQNGNVLVFVIPDTSTANVMSIVGPLLQPDALQQAVADPVAAVRVAVSGGPADVRHNFVSDGANFFVAVSRYDWTGQPVAVSVDVHPRVQSRLQRVGTYAAVSPFPLRPLETRFLRLPIELSASDRGAVPAGVVAVASAFAAVLVTLRSAGFDVKGAEELIARAREVAPTYPSRAVAALCALSRMIFVRVQHNLNHVYVWARYAWRESVPPGAGVPGVSPVDGGIVQTLFLENAHEELDVPPLDARGEVAFALPLPRQERWDFDPAVTDYRPPDPGNRLVEVHVVDPRTGATAFAVGDPRQPIAP